MPQSTKNTVRFNLELSAKYGEMVNELKEETGSRTQKEFFEAMIIFFKWALEQRRQGRVIASVDRERKVFAEIHMPELEYAAPSSSTPQSNGEDEDGHSDEGTI